MKDKISELTSIPVREFDPEAARVEQLIGAYYIDYSLSHPDLIDRDILTSFDISSAILQAYLITTEEKGEEIDEYDMEDLIEASNISKAGFAGGIANGLEVLGQQADADLSKSVNSTKLVVDMASEIALGKGITINEVFESDDYYLDLVRKQMKSPEESVESCRKGLDFLKKNILTSILESYTRGMVQGLLEDDEDREEVLAEFEREMIPEIREMMSNMLYPMAVVLKANLERAWGRETADLLDINDFIPSSGDSTITE